MNLRSASVTALLTAAILAVSVAGCRHDERPAKPKSKSNPVAGAKKSGAPRKVPTAGRTTAYRTSHTDQANNVLMRALSLVGTPYRYGGNTPEGGFDCSGLVNYVYRDTLDLKLPRTSGALAQYQGPVVDPTRLNTGDLVFFGTNGSVSHVGIYVGDGRFVHAPSTGGTVRMDRLDGPYWVSHYTGSKQILGY